jgi:chromatin remodeling complex protein RSC6
MNDMIENGCGSDADIQMNDAPADNDKCNNDNNIIDSAGTDADAVPISSTPNMSERNETEGQTESVVSVESTAMDMSQQQQTTPTQMLKLASRVPEIWSSFFRELHKIERMEMRVNEHVSRSRRRIMNLLEQTPSHRRTHLRMFVSHFFDKFKGIWTLAIEGKLLVGNLDHVNADTVEKEGVLSAREIVEEKEEERNKNKKSRPDEKLNSSSENLAASSGGAQTSSSDLGSNPATASNGFPITPSSSDRFQQSYRIGEKEEDPVPPLTFTHCFDKIEVTFRTIYQPRGTGSANAAALASSSFAKKSRSNKRKSSGQQAQDETVAVNPKLLNASEPTKLVWRKSDTIDSHAFFVKYNNHFSERPPPPGMRFFSVVAKIKLYPTRPGTGVNVNKYQFLHQQDANAEPLYQIVHPVLAKRFFPRHVYEESDESIKNRVDGSQSKDDDSGGMKTGGTESDPQQQQAPPFKTAEDEAIPLENDIRVSTFLTYNEISMSIFRYIQDNGLHDSTDRSTIICDKVLTEILEVESMSFGQLKQLLISKNLIRRVGAPEASSVSSPQKGGSNNQKQEPVMPVVLTYVMNEQTTSPHVPTGYEEESEKPDEKSSAVSAASASAIAKRRAAYTSPEDPDHNPTVLSFDMDVAIPSFFNYRARDLLRRVKKREFEYTTCRTKARYLLVAAKGNEDVIKTRIEKAVSGQGYEVDNIPVFLALAKAAMPHSEARGAAQIDARTCDIVGRIEEASHNVELAWEEVDAIRDAMRGSTEAADDSAVMKEDDGK